MAKSRKKITRTTRRTPVGRRRTQAPHNRRRTPVGRRRTPVGRRRTPVGRRRTQELAPMDPIALQDPVAQAPQALQDPIAQAPVYQSPNSSINSDMFASPDSNYCKSKYAINPRHPKYNEFRETFDRLCDLTTLYGTDLNLNAAQKMVLGLILGNANYTRKILLTLAQMLGISVTSDLSYPGDNDPNEILLGTNIDKPFAIPIALPNHINIVIVHRIDNVVHIEHFEPNGPYLTQYKDDIESDCRAVVLKAYPNMQIEYHAPNNICVDNSQRRMQSRININYKHSGSCSIFAMWYMFNRIIFMERESAQETFKRMDEIIKKNPKYISKLVYGFISVLSTEFPDLLIEIIMSAHSNYAYYVKFGEDIFDDDHKRILYNYAFDNNNLKLFQILYKNGYAYPGFDDDLSNWIAESNNNKVFKKVLKKMYDERNPDSPLQSSSEESMDVYYASDSNESESYDY